MSTPRIFISHAHTRCGPEPGVEELVARLRSEQFDVRIDLDDPHQQDWALYMRDELRAAAAIVVVCTRLWADRFDAIEDDGHDTGVRYEGRLLRWELLQSRGRAHRIVAVTLDAEGRAFVPPELSSGTVYRADTDIERLVERLRRPVGGPPPEPLPLHAPLARFRRRIYLVAAQDDRSPMLDESLELLVRGHHVDAEPDNAPRVGLDDRTRRLLQEADEVRVLWSASARRDPRVKAVLREAREQAFRDPSILRPPRRGFLVGRSLDGAPLPAELDARLDWPGWGVMLSAAGLMGLVAIGREQSWHPLFWGLVALLSALLAGVAVRQIFRRPVWGVSAAWFHRMGVWLGRAGVYRIAMLATRILDAIYGRRLLSWRALRVSTLFSVVPVTLVAVISALYLRVFVPAEAVSALPVEGFWPGFAFSMLVTLPLALGNVFFDFISLYCTRWLLKKVVRDLPFPVLMAVLVLDLVVILLCAVGTAYCCVLLSVTYTLLLNDAPLAWARQALVNTFLVLVGAADLHAALKDVLFTSSLATALALATAVLPSVAYLALLTTSAVNRLARRVPFDVLAETLVRLAHCRRGPWQLMLPLLTVLLGGVAGLHQSMLRVPDPPRFKWRAIDASACDGPCEVGCLQPDGCRPAGTAVARNLRDAAAKLWPRLWETLWDDDEVPQEFGLDTVSRTTAEGGSDFVMMRDEVVQELWTTVWREGPVRARFGLPENPSIYRGDRMAVDSVTWCDAVRFANLATLWLADRTGADLQPVYCVGEGCHMRDRDRTDPAHALDGCGTSKVVHTDHRANGLRLPTSVEWELAMRGGTRTRFWTGDSYDDLLQAEWLAENSGLRPHPVDQQPSTCPPLHPFGLRGMAGGTSEWTSTIADGEDPDDPAASRIVRGGTFGGGENFARSSFHAPWGPNFRFSWRGLRLVAPLGTPDVPSPRER